MSKIKTNEELRDFLVEDFYKNSDERYFVSATVISRTEDSNPSAVVEICIGYPRGNTTFRVLYDLVNNTYTKIREDQNEYNKQEETVQPSDKGSDTTESTELQSEPDNIITE